jgi:glycosyltransferase involved in cell wall biosynthesis
VRLQELWAEARPPAEDAEFCRLSAQLNAADAQPAVVRRPTRWLGPIDLIRHTGFQWGRSAVRYALPGAIYLNIGQLAWAIPVLTHWLRRRPDLRAIFMVHDVIPLDHPELVTPMGRRAHRWLMEAVARHASGLMLTTRAAGEAVTRTLHAMGMTNAVPTDVGTVPVPQVFLRPAEAAPCLASKCYFVICGAIEPRKNHAVLLDAWGMLSARHGAAAPQLIIAGAPGHGAAPVLARIAAGQAPNSPLIWARGLSSPALRQVMGHARALLMPSLAEGYGMPVAEALALGTPVIASDIAPHVEIAEGHASFCPPRDAAAWCAAIERLAFDEASYQEAKERAAGYAPVEAACYFQRIEAFLQQI